MKCPGCLTDQYVYENGYCAGCCSYIEAIMGNKTKIEWTDATWNPVTGCSKVSEGCRHCYAERLIPRAYGSERKFTDVRCHPERLDQPLRWRKPRRIFVNSISDLFHEAVPEEFIWKVFESMNDASWHIFQILTKRPHRMRKFLEKWVSVKTYAYGPFPWPYIWLGVSVEDQQTADQRIPLLIQTPAAVRWISAEPLLGPILLDGLRRTPGNSYPKLDWVVVGGESGPNARPMHPDWARSLRDQCIAAGVPFFFKQWGEWGPCQAAVAPPSSVPIVSRGIRVVMSHIVKKAAGRLLDGRTWEEFPHE